MPNKENELMFNAGFETKSENNVNVKVYKDSSAFEKNSPVPVEEIKKLAKYENNFNTGFIKTCIEDSKNEFKNGEDKVNYQAQNGISSSSQIKVNIVKEHTFTVGFGEEKKTITAPKISVGITKKGLYNKQETKKAKSDLEDFVKSL